MIDMDYEKAYKAVLQTATQWIKDGCTDKEKICLECVFPELAESEDERIRKWIVNLLHELHYNQTAQPMALKAIEYLEKQKEQKEIPLMNDDADLYFDEWNQQNQNPTKRQCFEEGMKYAQRLQKKQKPVEWSEEDEHRRKDAIYFLETAKSHYADTSELDSTIAWLKSLRPQPQGVYQQVIHTIFGMLKDKDFYEIQPSHRVSLLNDIRVKCKDAIECAPILDEPSWKPSEEQMEALRVTIDFMPDTFKPRCTLITLQNGLEKLM